MATQLSDAQRALIEANGFDPAALDTNRAGRLTPAQIERLRSKSRARGAALLVIGAIAVAFGVWGLVAPEGGRWGAATALVVGAAMIALRWSSFGRSHAAALANGRVASVDGPIEIRSVSGDGHDLHHYRIGGREFQTTEQGAKAIVPSATYRVYYLPDSDCMVNIEALS